MIVDVYEVLVPEEEPKFMVRGELDETTETDQLFTILTGNGGSIEFAKAHATYSEADTETPEPESHRFIPED